MITIKPRAIQLAAAHFLPRMPDGHMCRRMHGHTYKVRVEVGGVIRDGMLPDYAKVTACVRDVCDLIDHRTLNDIDGLDNPTTEQLAAWLADRIAPGIDALGGVLVGLVVDEGGHEAIWRPTLEGLGVR